MSRPAEVRNVELKLEVEQLRREIAKLEAENAELRQKPAGDEIVPEPRQATRIETVLIPRQWCPEHVDDGHYTSRGEGHDHYACGCVTECVDVPVSRNRAAELGYATPTQET